MSAHPDEFGGIQQRLLESALASTEQQFEEAERMVAKLFPEIGEAKAAVVVSVAQAIAMNYLAAATVRNLPKG
jgi:hypothetical protein